MSSYTEFDTELHFLYATKASSILRDDYWAVTKGFNYHIYNEDSSLRVSVPVGFLTDGASIPWALRSILPRMGIYSRASTLHDYLCETYVIQRIDIISGEVLGDIAVSRETIDNIFFEALAVDNCPNWKLILIKLGVNLHRILSNPRKPKMPKQKKELELEYAHELSPLK